MTRNKRSLAVNDSDTPNGKREMASSEAPERRSNGQDSEWKGFKGYVKRIASVPKEELDEKLAEEKREREEKQAG